MAALRRLKDWARRIKRDVIALYIAARDPRTPWFAKTLAFILAAYALSPIDLIPDFIPVVGLLDEAILLPLGILLVIRLIPPHVMNDARTAASRIDARPVSKLAAAMIICVWIAAAGTLAWLFWNGLAE